MPHICEAGEVHTELVDPEGKKQLGRPSINGRIRRLILTWIFKKWDGGGMYWIDLAQDRDIGTCGRLLRMW
jgi:hypothetical protein